MSDAKSGITDAPTDLTTLTEELSKEAASSGSGRASHAIHAAEQGRMSAIVLALRAGEALDDHENPGEAILHCLHGRVRLSSQQVDHELSSGEVVPVPQHRHRLDAIEDSTVILTISRGAAR